MNKEVEETAKIIEEKNDYNELFKQMLQELKDIKRIIYNIYKEIKPKEYQHR